MAVKSVGTLKASLLLDTSRWTAGFANATKQTKQFTGVAGMASRGIGAITSSMGTMATGAVSLTAAMGMMRNSFQEIDRQAKLADRLGITMEATQKLGLAAELSGTDLETLAKAMLHMNRTIGAGGMSLDKRFMQVAKQLQEIENPAQRANAAFRIFGKQSTELLNLFASADQINRSTEALDRMGLVLSRTDASKVEAANDALSMMWATLKGISNRIAVEVSPATKSWADGMFGDVERISKALDGMGLRWRHIGTIADNFMARFQELRKISRAVSGWETVSNFFSKWAMGDATKVTEDAATKTEFEMPKLKAGAVERGSIDAARMIQSIQGGETKTMDAVAPHLLREIIKVRENTDPARKGRRVVVGM